MYCLYYILYNTNIIHRYVSPLYIRECVLVFVYCPLPFLSPVLPLVRVISISELLVIAAAHQCTVLARAQDHLGRTAAASACQGRQAYSPPSAAHRGV